MTALEAEAKNAFAENRLRAGRPARSLPYRPRDWQAEALFLRDADLRGVGRGVTGPGDRSRKRSIQSSASTLFADAVRGHSGMEEAEAR